MIVVSVKLAVVNLPVLPKLGVADGDNSGEEALMLPLAVVVVGAWILSLL